MNQENKLLLQELSTRMPHGLFVAVKETDDDSTMIPLYDEDGNLDETNEPNIHSLVSCDYYGECDIDDYSTVTINEIIPYLRPMSSMTEEEKEELKSKFCVEIRDEDNGRHKEIYGYVMVYHNFNGESWYIPFEAIDWLNAHHLDYRGWIKEGRALEAPAGMYDSKNK